MGAETQSYADCSPITLRFKEMGSNCSKNDCKKLTAGKRTLLQYYGSYIGQKYLDSWAIKIAAFSGTWT